MTGLVERLALQDFSRWREARPFPHLTADGFVRDADQLEGLHLLTGELPVTGWKQQANKKRGLSDVLDNPEIPTGVQSIFRELTSPEFAHVLGEKTGVPLLQPDPLLRGGGLHSTSRGGILGIHVDFNRHPDSDLYRRLNLFIYLCHGWQAQHGGALELRADKSAKSEKRLIGPEFNRLVCFESSDHSWHGHPVPWLCDRPRLSLACYYYSPEPPPDYTRDHSTIYDRGEVKEKKRRTA
jgi:hypothetical protein